MHPKVKELLDKDAEEQEQKRKNIRNSANKLIEWAKEFVPEWAHEFFVDKSFWEGHIQVYLEIPDCTPIDVRREGESRVRFYVKEHPDKEEKHYLPMPFSEFEKAVTYAAREYHAFIQAQSQPPSGV